MPTQVNILVVDDEEVVLESVRKVLRADEEHEFVIDTVLSAAEGLDLMDRKSFDIVITDLMMPNIDGLQFIDRIGHVDPRVKVIMITGYATMRTALQALRKGAFDYIAKPFTKEELRNVVKNAARIGRVSARTGDEDLRFEGAADAAKLREYRTFFNQTYARILPDGTMYFGVEESFLRDIGGLLSIEVSPPGANVSQGFSFGSITNANMRVFHLRAPLSGRVLGVNREAVENTSLVREEPRGKGWLLHVAATDFENEVGNLGL
ncbi:MAG: response regulator [Candidatus Lindowbacteria bacterium]|nr:response regulator [Candidatus Lindowbacteria bacterium]